MIVDSVSETGFYSVQSVFSEPGRHAALYACLPTDPARLAEIVRGLMLHRLEVPRHDTVIPPDRLRDDAEARYVEEILALIAARDGSPLPVQRVLGNRFIGICRDFSLLHTSLLRHAGIPARIRSGFADYFVPGFWSDHVVTEYWTAEHGWRLADPQIVDTAAYPSLGFDPMNVPRDRFLVAGQAWRRTRAGEDDPELFGLPGTAFVGTSFIAGNLRLDLAFLNRTEPLLWDLWGTELADDDSLSVLFDQVAAATSPTVDVPAARGLFHSSDELRTPPVVRSVPEHGTPRDVPLRIPA
jgi:hypothetical protein